jgi:hypothetical protein
MFFQAMEDEVIQKELMTEQNFLVSFDKVIPLKDKAVYMLRNVDEGVAINMNELGSDLMYGELSPNIMSQFSYMLSYVFTPILD